jgi:hypothetical protein
MKTSKLLILLIATICVVFAGCSKFDDESTNSPQLKSIPTTDQFIENQNPGPVYFPANTWIENFTSPLFANQWMLYGNPKPQWVNTAYDKTGLFDNNGPSPTKNYAVSKALVGKGSGFIVEAEVRVQLINNNGTCICPGIAVSKTKDPVINILKEEIETGISMRIVYVGPNATWFPSQLRNHAWLVMDYMGPTGEMIPSGYFNADNFTNKWITLKLTVTNAGNVKFSCNDIDIWKPFEKINSDMKSEKNVVLGYTSAGNPATRAGVAYHNWVKGYSVIGPQE